MKYHTQPGVSIANIAGEHLLVAAGESRGKVPYIKNINKTGVWFWDQMVEMHDLNEIIEAAVKFYGITSEQAETATRSFFDSLQKEGYIIIDEN